MSNTPFKIVVDVTTKKVTLTGQIAVREDVDVTIVNLGTTSAVNLVLRILNRANETVAILEDLTASGSDAIGELDLNTDELIAEFTGSAARVTRSFKLGVWDESTKDLLANDVVQIMNNPFTDGADPVGAQDSRYIRAHKDTSSIRMDVNDEHFQLYDQVTGSWHTLTAYNGAVALGPGEV